MEIALAGMRAEELSVLTAPEPLVVHASAGPPLDAATRDALGRVPTVTVLVGAAGPADAAAFDVCLGAADPPFVDAPLDDVAAAVAEHPLAALALVGVMRTTVDAGAWAGLVSESAAYAALLGGREFRRWRDGRGVLRHVDADGPVVLVERDGDRMTVTLNRPGVHNAFDRDMRDQLVAALQLAAVDDSITTVLLRGEGPSFCSGGDLSEFGSVIDPPTAHAVRLTRHPGWWMHVCRDKLTTRAHGACLGAGIELPAFGSRIVASPDARFGLPEVGMGLIPGAGGTISVARRIGRQRATWMALTGTAIDAPTAKAWGLVDDVGS